MAPHRASHAPKPAPQKDDPNLVWSAEDLIRWREQRLRREIDRLVSEKAAVELENGSLQRELRTARNMLGAFGLALVQAQQVVDDVRAVVGEKPNTSVKPTPLAARRRPSRKSVRRRRGAAIIRRQRDIALSA